MDQDRKEIAAELEALGIDAEATFRMLDICNAGKAAPPMAEAGGLVGLDDPAVIDLRGELRFEIAAADFDRKAAEISLPTALSAQVRAAGAAGAAGAVLSLGDAELRAIGLALYSRTAYGVLNGGSATSFADRSRNQALSAPLFSLYEGEFATLAALAKDKPKALAPAFLQPDGSPGPCYLALKLRALLLDAEEAATAGHHARPGNPPLPFFQMTSALTDPPLSLAFEELASSPLLAPLAARTGCTLGRPELTGVQRMVAALTHGSAGSPRGVFTGAAGKPGGFIPLPGGHGQNFAVLEGIYRTLLARGYRWAYLGNVDNLGFTVEPRALAVVALSGANAGFDFSFRTPLDAKGGILVRTAGGKLSCADLGQAISFDKARELEASGLPVLFNCATGLFDLEWIVANIGRIKEKLPLRVSDQNKDVGKYSQAEQNTWEIIGMLDSFKVFAVEKACRFLAAKMLMETVMMSSPPLDRLEAEAARTGDAALAAFAGESRRLSAGLAALLREEYGLEERGGRYEAVE